jgi:hypothetical protein
VSCPLPLFRRSISVTFEAKGNQILATPFGGLSDTESLIENFVKRFRIRNLQRGDTIEDSGRVFVLEGELGVGGPQGLRARGGAGARGEPTVVPRAPTREHKHIATHAQGHMFLVTVPAPTGSTNFKDDYKASYADMVWVQRTGKKRARAGGGAGAESGSLKSWRTGAGRAVLTNENEAVDMYHVQGREKAPSPVEILCTAIATDIAWLCARLWQLLWMCVTCRCCCGGRKATVEEKLDRVRAATDERRGRGVEREREREREQRRQPRFTPPPTPPPPPFLLMVDPSTVQVRGNERQCPIHIHVQCHDSHLYLDTQVVRV